MVRRTLPGAPRCKLPARPWSALARPRRTCGEVWSRQVPYDGVAVLVCCTAVALTSADGFTEGRRSRLRSCADLRTSCVPDDDTPGHPAYIPRAHGGSAPAA